MAPVFLIAAVLGVSPIGLWQTGEGVNSGKVEITACGQALCGLLVDGAALRTNPDQRDVRNHDPALRSRPLKNLKVLDALAGGPPVWTGAAYDPKWGMLVKGVQLRLVSPNAMTVKGCVGVFCHTDTFERVR